MKTPIASICTTDTRFMRRRLLDGKVSLVEIENRRGDVLALRPVVGTASDELNWAERAALAILGDGDVP